jgi:hypothetical protein
MNRRQSVTVRDKIVGAMRRDKIQCGTNTAGVVARMDLPGRFDAGYGNRLTKLAIHAFLNRHRFFLFTRLFRC